MTTEGLSEKGCFERERRRSGAQGGDGNVPLDPHRSLETHISQTCCQTASATFSSSSVCITEQRYRIFFLENHFKSAEVL